MDAVQSLLTFGVSSSDPRLHFVFRNRGKESRKSGATHIDDICGCGEPDPLLKVRRVSDKRFGKMKAQEKCFAHVVMELPHGG